MKKQIIVINSPLFETENHTNTEDYLPPLGLGVIISAIESKCEVVFIDALADNLGINEIVARVQAINPAYACINVFTTNYSLVNRIVEQTKSATHWIIGGISTKSLYKEIFNWKTENPIDVVFGDGESIVNAIIDSKVLEKPVDTSPKRRYYIVEPTSKYFARNISEESVNRSVFKYEPQNNTYGKKEVSIYTSRGCPYNCAYCVAARTRNSELGAIRRKTVTSIILELEGLKGRYPELDAIRILDDLFLLNYDSFRDAISIFSKFRFSWRAMCHIKSIASVENAELEGIAKAGCKELFIGIESGSPAILKAIHKTEDIRVITNSVSRVLAMGISVKGYFICGLPDETLEDLDKTVELATNLTNIRKRGAGRFRNSTFQFRPYLGTELYDNIVMTKKIPYYSILSSMKTSEKLNDEVRNKSFNFDSGNYSSVGDDVLRLYIKRMNDLNEQHS